MTPDERAAMAREVLTQLVNEFTDGTIGEPFRLTPAQRARMLGYIDREYAAPTPTPPPIPLGAVVEVDDDPWSPYTRTAGAWLGNDGVRWDDGDDENTSPLVSALYHARREAEEHKRAADHWQEDAKRYAANAGWWRSRDAQTMRERDEARQRVVSLHNDALRCIPADWKPHYGRNWGDVGNILAEYVSDLQRERDEARRALDDVRLELVDENFTAEQRAMHALRVIQAATSQGLGPNEPEQRASVRAEPADPSPAPASAPRRWWLLVDCDETPRAAYEWDERHVADADAAGYNRSDDTFAPYTVIPVLEARVTREQYEALWHDFLGYRGQLKEAFGAALTALGLTVEDDHA